MATETETRQNLTETLTLQELVSRFMASRRRVSQRTGRPLSPSTLVYYRTLLDGLLYFAAQNDWPEPAQVTRDHLRDFMNYVTDEPTRWAGDGRRGSYRPASPGTVHHYLKVAKTLFNWAMDEGYLDDSPALRLKLPRANYKEVEPYTDQEVGAMLDLCEHDMQYGQRMLGIRNRAIVSVFIDTGLRLAELADMRLSEFDPQLQQVRVLGKGAKFRVVPLNGQARKSLRVYLTQARRPGGDEVWQTDDGQPLSLYSIRIMIERLKRRAGVRSGGGAHRFRHYFATRYLEGGGDMNSLRLLLGHATLYMVLRYTKFVNVQRALDEHRQVSPLDRLYNGGRKQSRDDGWGWRQ